MASRSWICAEPAARRSPADRQPAARRFGWAPPGRQQVPRRRCGCTVTATPCARSRASVAAGDHQGVRARAADRAARARARTGARAWRPRRRCAGRRWRRLVGVGARRGRRRAGAAAAGPARRPAHFVGRPTPTRTTVEVQVGDVATGFIRNVRVAPVFPLATRGGRQAAGRARGSEDPAIALGRSWPVCWGAERSAPIDGRLAGLRPIDRAAGCSGARATGA